jgi:hypothetical protein
MRRVLYCWLHAMALRDGRQYIKIPREKIILDFTRTKIKGYNKRKHHTFGDLQKVGRHYILRVKMVFKTKHEGWCRGEWRKH